MNIEPTHFLILINNGKGFSNLDGMTCFSFIQGSDKPEGIGFFETLRRPIYSKVMLITPEIMESLKFKTRMVEWGNY